MQCTRSTIVRAKTRMWLKGVGRMVNRRFEKLIATRLPGVASRGICLKKHDEAIDMLFDGITRWMMKLQDQYGPSSLEFIQKIQFDLGREMTEQLKREYRLGSTITDALDLMWLLIIPFGIKMKAQQIDDGRIREEKLACPIFDVFRRHGVDYCEELCVSLGNGWLSAIDPSLKFELVRRAGKDGYCIKDIVNTRKNDKNRGQVCS